MRDIVILAVTAAFFAVCLAYVRWCDHIIGPDPDAAQGDLAPAGRPEALVAVEASGTDVVAS